METARHLTTEELDAGLDHVAQSPADNGTLELVVCRPDVDQRAVLDVGELVIDKGLAGDNYLERGGSGTPAGKAHPEAQLNVMNSRIVDLVSGGDRSRWQLAGDQLLVDFDLSVQNAPVGTRLAIGSAVIEISQKPHTGCAKFAGRFGQDAVRWVNQNRDERRRGLNAMVVQRGTIRPGDTVTKLDGTS